MDNKSVRYCVMACLMNLLQLDLNAGNTTGAWVMGLLLALAVLMEGISAALAWLGGKVENDR